ncbi:putative membrane protein [Escherichia coli 1-110-08_S4_C1]|nr:putative membrane protein [Escherichia coli 1-110-08_S4_C1]
MLTRREWKRGQDIFVIEIAIILYSLKIFLIFIYIHRLLFLGIW